ncbi:hypothetical protein CH16_gp118 [Escherichia phage KBNP1711]|uniref:Uncharacterized protein n=2 Tax=Gordonclarkvirinae TaxID=3044644 RepID=A0A0D5BHZ3_9CAUD|nr:hypothetical protein CH16_gp118 [Escherichia phage KBNP1711]YP_009208158.1 hypothetical protein AVV18_gp010 [Escherichia phage 172-1]AHI60895.1 hypothetical protein ECBP3_0118 [Escherichia phage KBNP1711]AJW61375.1 hypothetical protein 1721_11 [Escherichia phage 172-1]
MESAISYLGEGGFFFLCGMLFGVIITLLILMIGFMEAVSR